MHIEGQKIEFQFPTWVSSVDAAIPKWLIQHNCGNNLTFQC